MRVQALQVSFLAYAFGGGRLIVRKVSSVFYHVASRDLCTHARDARAHFGHGMHA